MENASGTATEAMLIEQARLASPKVQRLMGVRNSISMLESLKQAAQSQYLELTFGDAITELIAYRDHRSDDI